MTTEILEQAAQFIKAGNQQAALPLLKQVIQADPRNEAAWIALYSCVDDQAQKRFCLQKILQINPNNRGARISLEKFDAIHPPISVKPAPIPATIEPPTQPRTDRVPALPVATSQTNVPVPPESAQQAQESAEPPEESSAAQPVPIPTPQGIPGSKPEKTYFQKDAVLITDQRLVFGAETHILESIDSVGSNKIPARKAPGRIIALVSFLLLIILLFSFIGGFISVTQAIVGGILLFAGFLIGLVVASAAKPRYVVTLVSGATSMNGFVSRDSREVTDIIRAINKAMIKETDM